MDDIKRKLTMFRFARKYQKFMLTKIWHFIANQLTKMLFLSASNKGCVFCPNSISFTRSAKLDKLFSTVPMSLSNSDQFCAICDKVSIWLSIEFIVFVHLRLMSVLWRWILSRLTWSATWSNFSASWFNVSIWSCWACGLERNKKIIFVWKVLKLSAR